MTIKVDSNSEMGRGGEGRGGGERGRRMRAVEDRVVVRKLETCSLDIRAVLTVIYCCFTFY